MLLVDPEFIGGGMLALWVLVVVLELGSLGKPDVLVVFAELFKVSSPCDVSDRLEEDRSCTLLLFCLLVFLSRLS